jgi:hypothetical protein
MTIGDLCDAILTFLAVMAAYLAISLHPHRLDL